MLLAAAQAGISTTLEAEMVRAGAVSIPVNLLTKETLAEIQEYLSDSSFIVPTSSARKGKKDLMPFARIIATPHPPMEDTSLGGPSPQQHTKKREIRTNESTEEQIA